MSVSLQSWLRCALPSSSLRTFSFPNSSSFFCYKCVCDSFPAHPLTIDLQTTWRESLARAGNPVGHCTNRALDEGQLAQNAMLLGNTLSLPEETQTFFLLSGCQAPEAFPAPCPKAYLNTEPRALQHTCRAAWSVGIEQTAGDSWASRQWTWCPLGGNTS